MKPKYQVLRVLCVIAAVVLLGWSLVEVGLTTSRTITRLLEVGWDGFIDRQGASGFLFALGCLSNETCEAAFSEVWLQEYPLYVPYPRASDLVGCGDAIGVCSSRSEEEVTGRRALGQTERLEDLPQRREG